MEELPDLPRYKLDENQQIVIDDLIENNENIDIDEKETEKKNQGNIELENQ